MSTGDHWWTTNSHRKSCGCHVSGPVVGLGWIVDNLVDCDWLSNFKGKYFNVFKSANQTAIFQMYENVSHIGAHEETEIYQQGKHLPTDCSISGLRTLVSNFQRFERPIRNYP